MQKNEKKKKYVLLIKVYAVDLLVVESHAEKCVLVVISTLLCECGLLIILLSFCRRELTKSLQDGLLGLPFAPFSHPSRQCSAITVGFHPW